MGVSGITSARWPYLTWRMLAADDRDGLTALDKAYKRAYGDEPVSNLVGDALAASPDNTLGAFYADGQMAAVAWVQPASDKRQIALNGRVHPDERQRGLGTALLQWSEQRARSVADNQPVSLTIANESLTADAHSCYTQRGFRQLFVEEMMVCDLRQPIPEAAFPSEVTLQNWSVSAAALFFRAYQVAFKDRPGFPDPPEADWISDYAASDAFRPLLSQVALVNHESVAFITCEQVERYGWVAQMGVIPAWRGHGLGRAMLANALHGFQDSGFNEAALHVNVNNPSAVQVYTGLGFISRLRRARYIKQPSTLSKMESRGTNIV